MGRRRPLRATDIAGSSTTKGWLGLILLVIAAVGVFFMLHYFSGMGNYDRMKKARDFSQYYKEYFYPRVFTFKVFDDKVPLRLKSTNMGRDFIEKTFPSMLTETEQEVSELLSYRYDLNKPDPSDEYKKQEIFISQDSPFFRFLATGRELSKKTPFNIASGEIHNAWVRAFKRKQTHDRLIKRQKRLLRLLSDHEKHPGDIEFAAELREQQDSDSEKHLGTTADDIPRMLRELRGLITEKEFEMISSHVTRHKESDDVSLLIAALLSGAKTLRGGTSVLPDMSQLKKFIPIADPTHISADKKTGRVQINNINTAILLRVFREAFFLDILRKKLPEKMNYIIHLGSRHGIWKLPEKYQRWVVSLDNPYNLVTEPAVAGIGLYPESGAFVTTRKREEFFMWDGREYDLPVDWRTAFPEKQNISALVVSDNAVIGRMLSYALFIADKDEISDIEHSFPDTPFLLLRDTSTVKKSTLNVCPAVARELKPFTRPDATVSLTSVRSRLLRARRQLSNDEKQKEEKIRVTVYYLERDSDLYVPAAAKQSYVPIDKPGDDDTEKQSNSSR